MPNFSNYNGTPECGTMYVETDHVIAGFFDPGYYYNAITSDNVCASIDFGQWISGGGWTDIVLHYQVPTVTNPGFDGEVIQVRNDNGHQSFQVYLYPGDPGTFGALSFDLNVTHTLKACAIGSTTTAYLDNQQFFTGQSSVVGLH